MLDFGQLASESLFPVAILIFGGMLLYFGKIIQDIQVDSGGKFQYYFNGIVFSTVVVVIPVGFSYLIYESRAFIIDSLYFWAIVQLIILSISTIYMVRLEKMRQKGLSIKRTKDEQHLLISTILMIISIISWTGAFYNYALLVKYQMTYHYLVLTMSIIIIIFIMTIFAMIFSYYNVYYPTVRIHMDDLSVVKGKLIKYDETIRLVFNNRLVRINRNKILFVEELD